MRVQGHSLVRIKEVGEQETRRDIIEERQLCMRMGRERTEGDSDDDEGAETGIMQKVCVYVNY